VFRSGFGEIRYPSETIRDLSMFNTFIFSTSASYDKFRTAISLKFDTALPEVNLSNNIDEVAPKGWEGTVKSMKKHKDINNPWALAHWMKGKGYKSHKNESYWKNIGFNIRSDDLWPATLIESDSTKEQEDFFNWFEEQKSLLLTPNPESKCILAMIIHTGEKIKVVYGVAKYIDQTESHYILEIPSGQHQYSKKNQLVFDSKKSFEKFLTLLNLKFKNSDTDISIEQMPVMETERNQTEDLYLEHLASQLAEKIPPGASVDYYIKDFAKSNAPQFRGKSPEKRRQMAIAAHYAAQQPKKTKRKR
jgi:hypothetical protein